MVAHEYWNVQGNSLLLKIITDKDENKAHDKQQLDWFSVEQMAFLCTLVGEQDPPNFKSGKGKELTKMSTKEMDKLVELL